MAMSEDKRGKQDIQAYRRRDLGYGGKQEPDDTLVNRRHARKL